MKLTGLTAREVELGIKKYGLNEIADKGGRSKIKILGDQFKSPLVWLLFLAGTVSFFISEVFEALLIYVIVLLNAFLGWVQEFKAEDAIAGLKKIGISKVRVRRDGMDYEIDVINILPGDVVFLEEGVTVPGDGTLLEVTGLEINESVLTGESLPLTKEVESYVYKGTIVSRGRGWMKINAIGKQTKFGKLAEKLVELIPEKTPLEVKLDRLAKIMVGGGIAAGVALVGIAFIQGRAIVEAGKLGVSLAVAVIPEGLPSIIAITLAIGVQRMAREKAIVRRMAAIEALGATTVIATDKTGTLTKNIMEIEKVVALKSDLPKLIEVGVMTSSAVLNGEQVIGDQTEGAILKFALKSSVDIVELKERIKVLVEWPFDGKVKMTSGVFETGKKMRVGVKGAPEEVLKRCKNANLKEVELEIKTMASQGLRVIGFGYKDVKKISITREDAESELTWLGMVGIADPVRPESRKVVALARDLGIRVLMITGDNELTAKKIAAETGIESQNVYARIHPEQKEEIVKKLQAEGEIVVMTGDGVNDAIALSRANVGFAMGKAGTDVARGSADFVLLDDNLKTIVVAIRQGRVIVGNVTRVVKYLVAGNLGEVLTIFIAIAFGWPAPLLPVQILWVNLVSDGLPALAIATENTDKGSNKVQTGKWIIGPTDMPEIVLAAILIAVMALIGFYLWGRAGGFTFLVIAQMLLAVAVHGPSRLSKSVVLAIGGTLAVQVAILLIPELRIVFGLN